MKGGRGEGRKKSGRREKRRKRRKERKEGEKEDNGILTKKADVQFVECVF